MKRTADVRTGASRPKWASAARIPPCPISRRRVSAPKRRGEAGSFPERSPASPLRRKRQANDRPRRGGTCRPVRPLLDPSPPLPRCNAIAAGPASPRLSTPSFRSGHPRGRCPTPGAKPDRGGHTHPASLPNPGSVCAARRRRSSGCRMLPPAGRKMPCSVCVIRAVSCIRSPPSVVMQVTAHEAVGTGAAFPAFVIRVAGPGRGWGGRKLRPGAAARGRLHRGDQPHRRGECPTVPPRLPELVDASLRERRRRAVQRKTGWRAPRGGIQWRRGGPQCTRL